MNRHQVRHFNSWLLILSKSVFFQYFAETVEVMVQPKMPPQTTTTTTTPKPLPRHNFNTQACSGCFLTNGNNKPGSSNAVGDNAKKTDTRPLSKAVPSSSAVSASNFDAGKKNPSGIRNFVLYGTSKYFRFFHKFM